jgi:hypothetical protein
MLRFAEWQHVNQLDPTHLSFEKSVQDRRCQHCGAQAQLTGKMLDSARGRIIRMFKCECGEQTWTSDPK